MCLNSMHAVPALAMLWLCNMFRFFLDNNGEYIHVIHSWNR